MRRRSADVVLFSALLVGASGCSAGDGPASAIDPGALRARFPAHAARVLDGAVAFRESAEGFAPQVGLGGRAPGALGATLPRRAGVEAIRLELPEGLTVHVRESGLRGEGAREGAAVRYPRDGGASYWVATGAGVEEWLLVEPGFAAAGRPVASWEVDGAWPRQQGESIVWSDGSGVPRLIMSAPEAFGASGRPVRVALRAAGRAVELLVDAGDAGEASEAGEALLIDPAWVAALPMNQAREGHTATLLQDGRVLVAGGTGASFRVLSSAELFQPATGTWLLTAPMSAAREGHTATLLPSGDVLVVGGATAELYHPATNLWSAAAPPGASRAAATATLLEDGTVFVTGGTVGSAPAATTERYDPASDSWAPRTSMARARSGHAAVRLLDGRVLVVGGSDSEVYDPATDSWAPPAITAAFHDRHTATLLPDGRVLLVGGTRVGEGAGDARTIPAEVYDPGASVWSLPGLSFFRGLGEHTATLLPDGKVLLVGGYYIGLSSGDPGPAGSPGLFDPATGDHTSGVGSLDLARHTATLLLDQRVLVAGGFNPGRDDVAVATTAIYGVALGAACASGSDCTAGHCVDGVCCDAACDGGPCDACSVAAGASQDGRCEALTGPVCDDGQACTHTDVCRAGACAGTPVACAAPDACHEAACEAATGECVTTPRLDGAACDDGDGCTQGDTCEAGACVAGAPVACPPPPACHAAGVCDPATGACASAPLPDGEACDDGDACTREDTCRAGACEGGAPVSCAETDCRYAGSCDPATGACDRAAKPDGTPCGGGICVAGECAVDTGGAGGEAGAPGGSAGAGGSDSPGGGGCGCAVGASRAAPAPWAALLVLLSLARRARSPARRRRWGALAVLLLAGCAGDAVSPPGPEQLGALFPEHAAAVVGGDPRFVRDAGGGGFVARAPSGFEASLPERGERAVALRLPGGIALSVREGGLSGPAALHGQAVAYARPGGTSFWTASGAGYEEWLLLDEETARGAGPVASWEVEGAALRAREGVVDCLDGGGAVALTVSAGEAYQEDGAPVEARLDVRGRSIALWLGESAGAVLVDPAWIPAGNLVRARSSHTATLLPSGLVLLTGGSSGSSVLNSAELYDSATNTFTPAASMGPARVQHTATLLPTGEVLVVGGHGVASALVDASVLYNPTTNRWSSGPSQSRHSHTATLLQDGRVLVTGGESFGFRVTADAALYTAGAGWSGAGEMAFERDRHAAALLPSGDVLVIGAVGTNAERYDPDLNRWTATPPAPSPHYYQPTATTLLNGKVLVVGAAESELYNPDTDVWESAPPRSALRSGHTATLLPSGEVLIVGGGTASVELYRPSTNSWTELPPLSAPRAYHTATLLPDGRVLIAGGSSSSGEALASAEIYGAGAGLGAPCASDAACVSGHCVDGVCCNTACAGGCGACTVARGAAADGTCAPLSGTPCDDGDACTEDDTCAAGTCAPGAAVTCPAPGPCRGPGACEPSEGCVYPALPDETPCDDEDACTPVDRCEGGACVGADPVACEPSTCQPDARCDPAQGVCAFTPAPDGTGCDDGDACTVRDACRAGVCTGPRVRCPAAGPCQRESTCDPATGQCSALRSLPDGTPCPGGECVGGQCLPPSEASASSAGAGAGPGEDPEGGGGCGCRAARGHGRHGAAAVLGVVLIAARRRRTRRAG
ncbi:Kelch repeat-containing protein [Sorangium sp. So ce131]|uniref:Kelch repeat-containing protein n=1 Tax=Sorangium sp. So ce131 TaxID=3133282 RepID=UPI003F5DD956